MIYLDYASTTPVIQDVLKQMLPYFESGFANSSSSHRAGKSIAQVIEKCRATIASSINATTDEIFFTSCATESNNWVIKNIPGLFKVAPKHIITSKIEHNSVLESCFFMEQNGIKVDYIPIDKDGFVNIDLLANAITKDTALISIMFANNEIGTIQDIAAISKLANKNNILFHTDAVQAYCKCEIDVRTLGIDLMSISSHKIYGPKGIAALYVKKGTPLHPLMHGGHHERAMRSGTLNTPAIVGFAAALSHYMQNRDNIISTEKKYRDYIIDKLSVHIPELIINGTTENRLCNNVNVSIPNTDHNKLLTLLDLNGICVSAGSACSSGIINMSHVIKALNENYSERGNIDGAIRITCSYLNTHAEIEEFIDKFITIAKNKCKK